VAGDTHTISGERLETGDVVLGSTRFLTRPEVYASGLVLTGPGSVAYTVVKVTVI